jgi:hypothetical protein
MLVLAGDIGYRISILSERLKLLMLDDEAPIAKAPGWKLTSHSVSSIAKAE